MLISPTYYTAEVSLNHFPPPLPPDDTFVIGEQGRVTRFLAYKQGWHYHF